MEKKLDIGALGEKVKQYRKEKGYSAEKLKNNKRSALMYHI